MKRALVTASLLVLAAIASARPPASDITPLSALKFLEGKWVGEGSSESGKGGGYATFDADLPGTVIVRRNHAEYPSADGKPPYVHDDLMIIYSDPQKALRAFYTDNEGHVIHYSISASADGSTITFLSDADGAAPRYRLSYTRIAADKMTIVLEVGQGTDAPSFHKVVDGKMVKAAAAKSAKP